MLFTAGVYWIGPIIGIKVYLAALLFVEFVAGLALGYAPNRPEIRRMLLAAGAGGFIGFLPLILTTYGLALAVAPVFLLYLGVFYIGIRFSRCNIVKN